MRKILVTFLLVSLLSSLFGEGPLVLPPEVASAVQLNIDRITNFYFEKDWRKQHIREIIHPDSNYLGGSVEYDVPHTKSSPLQGLNLFLSAEILNFSEKEENIGFSVDAKLQTAYFVTIGYNLVAKTEKVDKKANLRTLSDPEKYYELWVFTKDPADQKFKLIDIYPSFKNYLIAASYYIRALTTDPDYTAVKSDLLKKYPHIGEEQKIAPKQ